MSLSTDGTLVIRTWRGEIAAYGTLINCYQDMVFNICYRLLGERKEVDGNDRELNRKWTMKVWISHLPGWMIPS